MIRPFTLITMLLAAGSGAYLFAVKHHAQMLDDQMADISQESRLDAQRIRVLQAQWALETDPTTLQKLASRFTGLQPMQPAQLVTLAALKTSLPAPGSAPPASNPELPGLTAPELDASADQSDAAPDAQLASALPMPPPLAPDSRAIVPPQALPSARAAAPMMAANSALAPRPLVKPAHRVNHSVLGNAQFAAAALPPRSYALPHFAPAPSSGPAERSLPMGAQVMSVKASATIPQYTPPARDNSGSVLGMSADLPPPQPLPQSGD